MGYAVVDQGPPKALREIYPGLQWQGNGYSYGANWLDAFSDPDYREAHHLFAIVEPPAPEEWQMVTSTNLVFIDTGVFATSTVERQQWLSDVPLSQWKATISSRIDAKRNQLLAQGFTFASGSPAVAHTYQSDEVSLARILRNYVIAQGHYMVHGDGQGYRWADADSDFYWVDALNQNVNMTAKDVMDLHARWTTFESAIVLYGRELKAQVEAAASIAAVNAINIYSGWPS